MSTGFQTLNVTSSCTGLHVLLGSRGASGEPGGRPELALATLIGEHEAGGEAVTTVTLRLARSEDAFWAQAALRWAETTSVMSSKTISLASRGSVAPRTSSVSVAPSPRWRSKDSCH